MLGVIIANDIPITFITFMLELRSNDVYSLSTAKLQNVLLLLHCLSTKFMISRAMRVMFLYANEMCSYVKMEG